MIARAAREIDAESLPDDVIEEVLHYTASGSEAEPFKIHGNSGWRADAERISPRENSFVTIHRRSELRMATAGLQPRPETRASAGRGEWWAQYGENQRHKEEQAADQQLQQRLTHAFGREIEVSRNEKALQVITDSLDFADYVSDQLPPAMGGVTALQKFLQARAAVPTERAAIERLQSRPRLALNCGW